MAPKENGINLSETACGLCTRIVRCFLCSLVMARDGYILGPTKAVFFLITDTQFAIQGQVR